MVGEEGSEGEEEKKAEGVAQDDSDDDVAALKEDLKKLQDDLETHEILKEFKEKIPK